MALASLFAATIDLASLNLFEAKFQRRAAFIANISVEEAETFPAVSDLSVRSSFRPVTSSDDGMANVLARHISSRILYKL